MSPGSMVRCGALLGAAGVGLGAFGAHGLRDRLAELETADVFETAVRYHLVHAVAIVVCAALAAAGGRARTSAAAWCFLAGVAIFSGTLYGYALGGPRWLGAITPIGGTLLIAGWLALALPGRRAPAGT